MGYVMIYIYIPIRKSAPLEVLRPSKSFGDFPNQEAHQGKKLDDHVEIQSQTGMISYDHIEVSPK